MSFIELKFRETEIFTFKVISKYIRYSYHSKSTTCCSLIQANSIEISVVKKKQNLTINKNEKKRISSKIETNFSRKSSQENLIALKKWYQMVTRRLYTWKSPQDRPNNIVRNQTDHITIPFRNYAKRASIYLSSCGYINSDHNLVVVDVAL